jgi:hypothetical protein
VFSRYPKKGKYPYGILIDPESLKTGLQNGTIFDLIKGELCKNVRADFYLIAKRTDNLITSVQCFHDSSRKENIHMGF